MFKDQIIRYKIIYDRKKQAAKKGKALVQIEAYQSAKHRYFSTGIYLSPDQWSLKKNEPKDPYTLSRIRSFVTTLEDYEKKHRYYNGGAFTLQDFDRLADQLNAPKADVPVLTVNQFFREQLQARKKELEHGTYKNHNACLNTLNEFNPAIRFEDLKYKLIDQFHQFMIAKGHKHFTWHKRHVQLKTYLRKAVKLGILNRNPYEDYPVPTPQSDKKALMIEEVEWLEQLTFAADQGRRQRVRDMFLFAIYTGLRWSDVSSLTRANFIETADGLVMEVQAAKTDKTLKLPLRYLFEGKAEPLVRKYWPDQDGAKLFRGIVNHFANLQLKEIATMAGIRKNVHFHMARHTAGTILVQKIGVAATQQVLQHTKLATTQIYVHLSHSDLHKAIRNVKDWK